jgi:hypothetical protein
MIGPVALAPGEYVLFKSQGGTHERDKQLLDLLKETWLLVPADQRRTFHDYYSKLHNGWPQVLLGFAIPGEATGIAQAGGPGRPYMLRFVLPMFFEWLGDRRDRTLAIPEELAHAYMFAIGHESHMKKPPNNNSSSPEHRAYIEAQENAMKEVLYSWPFVDRVAHKNVLAAVKAKAEQLRKTGG